MSTPTRMRSSGLLTRLSLHGWLAVAILLSGCEKFALDRQMEELCKKDGGVKVYETVTLPPEMFDQWGDPFPGWRGRTLEDRLGPEYRYAWKPSI